MEIAPWVTSAIVVIVASLISFLGASFTSQAYRKRKKEAPNLEDRITTLTDNLKNSSTVISEIEAEIQNRAKMVEKLRDDVKLYEQLREISQSQVEAVAQTIRSEITHESKRSFWRNAIITFVIALAFFFLGFWLRGV